MENQATSRPIKVLIASIDFGGGHKELKNNLIRSLSNQPDIEVVEYHSPNVGYDKLYRNLALHTPRLYILISRAGKLPGIFTRIMPLFGRPEIISLTKAIEQAKPDIVISTVSMLSVISLYIRKKQHLSFIAVNCQPDYGDVHREVHPEDPADYYLVRDQYTLDCVRPYLPHADIRIYGTTVNPAFTEAADLNQEQLKQELGTFFKDQPYAGRFNPDLPTVLSVGGSGWTRKSHHLLSRLAKTGKCNVMVLCGMDKKFYQQLGREDHIIPLQMLKLSQVALLERMADILCLSAVAPASMNEMMEVNHSPILVHRYIKNQEEGNLEVLKRRSIALEETNDDKMLNIILQFLNDPRSYQEMLKASRQMRAEEQQKASSNPDLIRQIFAREHSAQQG